MQTATELPIGARAGRHRPPGFEELYAAHFGDLAVQLYAYFGDRQEALDVVQEAFCRALAQWPRLAEYDDPVAWVRRVAWNLATSRWRRARTALRVLRRQRVEYVAEPSPDRVALVAALATLPRTQRRALVLHYLADLPVDETARCGTTIDEIADGVGETTVTFAGEAFVEISLERDEAASEADSVIAIDFVPA